MKRMIVFLLLFPALAFADGLSYSDRSNSGENKHERIGNLETYITKLSSNLSKIHSKMTKDLDKKLKDLEKKLSNENKKQTKKIGELGGKLNPLLKKDFTLKRDTNVNIARMDRFQKKIVELTAAIKQLELEVSTLKELESNSSRD